MSFIFPEAARFREGLKLSGNGFPTRKAITQRCVWSGKVY